MKISKKGQGITMNTIVIAVLAILVLVTLAIIFSGKLFKFGQKTSEIENAGGNLDAATCQMKCNNYNMQCILQTTKDGETLYEQNTNTFCINLKNEINSKCKQYVEVPSTTQDKDENKIMCRPATSSGSS